jgi:hypothetical protein
MPLTEADADKAYACASDAIQNRIKVRVGRKCAVVFSAYKLDADKVPIDNLDDVPVTGKLIIRGKRDRIHGGHKSQDYESPIMHVTMLDEGRTPGCGTPGDRPPEIRNPDPSGNYE